MELIKTKELYENDAFVIIEAEFEDSETKKRIQEIALGLKNNLGDITKIRTIHRGKSTGVPVKVRSVISFST